MIGQNNSVLATQQLSELSTELSRVRAGRGAAEATAQSVRAALASGASLDAFPEVLSSELIQRLRERQVQLKADIADLSTTLLDNHPRLRALALAAGRPRQPDPRRGAKGPEGPGDAGADRKVPRDATAGRSQHRKAASARAGDEEVELRSLEREAAAQRELLESYLTRYREASSRKDRSYLPADARIFSSAVAPSEPYFPKIVPIVGAAFAASLLIMAVVTLLQELFSGRAMRAAPGARFDPVSDVEMLAVRDEEPDMAPAVDVAEEVRPQPAEAMRPLPAEPVPEPRPVQEPKPAPKPSIGEISVESAAERLIAGGAARAIVVSPEGDEAAATAVMLAREVADAGLRVLLLDLTASGAASRPMLESTAYAGITNLLASEAQFADVIHADLYSDCHVIPVGTADPVRAMRAADRLPIIMELLTTAYDVVVVECGPADPDAVKRLVGPGTEILVSVLETDDTAVTETAKIFREHGYQGVTLVSPAGHELPPPLSGTRAA